MSRFFNEAFESLRPYTQGEQGVEAIHMKLNTNESPFPPSSSVLMAVSKAATSLNLYSDPEGKRLCRSLAEYYCLDMDQIMLGNGSDELLYLAFRAYASTQRGVVCPEISYGFYPVYAQMAASPYLGIPLQKNLNIRAEDFCNLQRFIVIANPNSPTGLSLSVQEVERILKSNRDYPVLIDEAYVDFGAESCLPLISKYDNLLVMQTFSKSRSLAGARLGFIAGSTELISDLQRLRYSLNPYNVNAMTLAAGEAAMQEDALFRERCQILIETREWSNQELVRLGFRVTQSLGNFLFVSPPDGNALAYARALRNQGILVRHFAIEPIVNYVRISVGTWEQMKSLLAVTKELYQRKGAMSCNSEEPV